MMLHKAAKELQKLQHKANDNEEDLHDIVKELVPTYIGEHA